MSWEVREISTDEIHVIPINDTFHHSDERTPGAALGFKCRCGIRLGYKIHSVIVIHSSFDGREGVEIVNEILNGK